MRLTGRYAIYFPVSLFLLYKLYLHLRCIKIVKTVGYDTVVMDAIPGAVGMSAGDSYVAGISHSGSGCY